MPELDYDAHLDRREHRGKGGADDLHVDGPHDRSSIPRRCCSTVCGEVGRTGEGGNPALPKRVISPGEVAKEKNERRYTGPARVVRARWKALQGGAIIPGLIILALVFPSIGSGDGGHRQRSGPDRNAAAQGNATLNGPGSRRTSVSFMSHTGRRAEVRTKTFAASGRTYTDAKLVLFTGSTSFWMRRRYLRTSVPTTRPADDKVWSRPRFFRELRIALGLPGDFAQAYVLLTIGHHVQDLLGISDKVDHQMQSSEGGVRRHWPVGAPRATGGLSRRRGAHSLVPAQSFQPGRPVGRSCACGGSFG